MTKAIYAFSGDPITYGHVDIVERAARLFEHVVVGIGVNPKKKDKYMFSLEERADMARKSLAGISNVSVTSFTGLLVDFAYEQGIKVIVKGIRNMVDFDYEHGLHQAGESQGLSIETIPLFAKPHLSHVSSSMVKGIQAEYGLIQSFVPLYVKQCLEEKMINQNLVGITGESGCGKSYISRRFVELGQARGMQVHEIDLDAIGHQVLGSLQEPAYQEVRTRIADRFGPATRSADGSIDRKALGSVVFNDPSALQELNDIMNIPMEVRIKRERYGKEGMMVFNAALIAESGYGRICNNNVILVDVDKPTQKARLESRDHLSAEQVEKRLASQYTFNEKRSRLYASIARDHHGKVWTVDNSQSADSQGIEKVFEAVVSELKVR